MSDTIISWAEIIFSQLLTLVSPKSRRHPNSFSMSCDTERQMKQPLLYGRYLQRLSTKTCSSCSTSCTRSRCVRLEKSLALPSTLHWAHRHPCSSSYDIAKKPSWELRRTWWKRRTSVVWRSNLLSFPGGSSMRGPLQSRLTRSSEGKWAFLAATRPYTCNTSRLCKDASRQRWWSHIWLST